jgi:hypothetical protein
MAVSRIVQDAADEAFGPSARVHLQLREPDSRSAQPRVWVAWAGDESTIYAVGVGDTTDGAFRSLIRATYAADHTLDSRTVAAILGVSPRRVTAMQAEGKLVPVVTRTGGPLGARFNPTDMLRRAGLLGMAFRDAASLTVD